jgi:hypothetical protein
MFQSKMAINKCLDFSSYKETAVFAIIIIIIIIIIDITLLSACLRVWII